MSGTPIYQLWFDMLRRCNDATRSDFHLYGGRGIKVCERWKSFVNFFADMGDKPDGASLDRFPDNNGNYEPGNCRWASAEEQARNTRANRQITYDGRTQPLAAWAEEMCVGSAVIAARLDVLGWSVERALTEPILSPGKRKSNNVELTYKGQTMILSDWARELGIPKGTLYHRVVRLRWPLERAFKQERER